eukprot:6209402-Pleurochrysis_carterae.AAC.5
MAAAAAVWAMAVVVAVWAMAEAAKMPDEYPAGCHCKQRAGKQKTASRNMNASAHSSMACWDGVHAVYRDIVRAAGYLPDFVCHVSASAFQIQQGQRESAPVKTVVADRALFVVGIRPTICIGRMFDSWVALKPNGV